MAPWYPYEHLPVEFDDVDAVVDDDDVETVEDEDEDDKVVVDKVAEPGNNLGPLI